MEVLLERCAGMDVHQETIGVCVMITDLSGEIQSETRTFGTLTKHLFELLKYLESHAVTHIAMESTGIRLQYPRRLFHRTPCKCPAN